MTFSRFFRAWLLIGCPNCWYCGLRMKLHESTIDHFVPRSKGGDGSWENLRLACRLCNDRKSDLPAESLVCPLGRGLGVFPIFDLEIYQRSTKMSNEAISFNYDALNEDVRISTNAHAQAIHDHLERTTANRAEID